MNSMGAKSGDRATVSTFFSSATAPKQAIVSIATRIIAIIFFIVLISFAQLMCILYTRSIQMSSPLSPKNG